ncbi:MAG TPA: mechanosensitive ion channel family protein [Firmicutes bacterium]|nr:mechanosensitive ion channel family protein [Candidatus Fermentithermobacillaceae bacterium]
MALEAATLLTWTGTAVRIALVVFVTGILVKIGDSLVERVFARGPRMGGPHFDESRGRTLASLLKSALRYVATTVAALTVLQLLGIDIRALLGGVAIVGLAVGFGAQSLVKDVITGFFIIYERQYDVGDYITAAGLSGVVLEVGLRTTKLRDWSGDIHTIPNGLIDKTTNSSAWASRALVKIPIAHDEDVRRAMAIIQEVCDEIRKENPNIIDGPRPLGIGDMDTYGVTITVWARTKPLEQFALERELRLRIKEALDREGVKRPYLPIRMKNDP